MTTPTPPDPQAPPGHTRHEAEVAALVSQGYTQEAAEAAVTEREEMAADRVNEGEG